MSFERPESRKSDTEPKVEKEVTAQEVVERFRTGESFYVRNYDAWEEVIDMKTEDELDHYFDRKPNKKQESSAVRRDLVCCKTSGAKTMVPQEGVKERWNLQRASELIDDQATAKQNFVPEYLSAQRKITERAMEEIDYADRSTAHKRQIVEDRYANRIAQEVIDEFSPREDQVEPSYNNNLHTAIRTITDWSAGIDLEEGQRIYPGWNQEDFTELLKLIMEKREQLHQAMLESLNRRESYTSIMEKIEEGNKAKKRLAELTLALQVEHGAFLRAPSGH